jgi:hypothetical protein
MRTRTWIPLSAAAGLAALALLAGPRGGAWAGASKDKDKGPKLRCVATYAEGVAEAKVRSTILYAILHKDN